MVKAESELGPQATKETKLVSLAGVPTPAHFTLLGPELGQLANDR